MLFTRDEPMGPSDVTIERKPMVRRFFLIQDPPQLLIYLSIDAYTKSIKLYNISLIKPTKFLPPFLSNVNPFTLYL